MDVFSTCTNLEKLTAKNYKIEDILFVSRLNKLIELDIPKSRIPLEQREGLKRMRFKRVSNNNSLTKGPYRRMVNMVNKDMPE